MKAISLHWSFELLKMKYCTETCEYEGEHDANAKQLQTAQLCGDDPLSRNLANIMYEYERQNSLLPIDSTYYTIFHYHYTS